MTEKQKLIQAFKALDFSPVQEIIHWYNKMKDLASELELNYPFIRHHYKEHQHINSIYREVCSLVEYYNKNHLAQKACKEYEEFDKENEKKLVSWLLNYEVDYYLPVKKTDKWEKTGIFILETDPNLVVDCTDFLDSFLFDELHNKHHTEIMIKYRPSDEHFDLNGGSLTYSLETF